MCQERTSIYVYVNWDGFDKDCDVVSQLKQLHQIRDNHYTRSHANINIVLLKYVGNPEQITKVVDDLVRRGDFFVYTMVVFTTETSDLDGRDESSARSAFRMDATDGTAARYQERNLVCHTAHIPWSWENVVKWFSENVGNDVRLRIDTNYYVYHGRIDEFLVQQHGKDHPSRFRTPMYICTYSEFCRCWADF